jgi:hypothetical protein
MQTQTTDRIKELQALAIEHYGRLYYSQQDGRWRVLYRWGALFTFSGLTEAERMINLIPIPNKYHGDWPLSLGAQNVTERRDDLPGLRRPSQTQTPQVILTAF